MAAKSKTPNIDRAVKFILENQGKYCCVFEESDYGDVSYLKSGQISEVQITSEEIIYIRIIGVDYEEFHVNFNSDYVISILEPPKDA